MSIKDRLNNSNNPQYYDYVSDIVPPKPIQKPQKKQSMVSLGAVQSLFSDDEISSIYVRGAKNIYIERKGKILNTSLAYGSNEQLEQIIRDCARNENDPYLFFSYKKGISVSATLPPLSNVPYMSIKLYKEKFGSLSALQDYGSISKEVSKFLETLTKLPLNIVITGKKNSMKTALLNALIKTISPNIRASLIDYKKELKINIQNLVSYDFSLLQNDNILYSVMDEGSELTFLNGADNDFSKYMKYFETRKGIIATYACDNPQSFAEKFLKKGCHPCVDIVIHTDKIQDKRCVISISEIDDNLNIRNIFMRNDNNEFVTNSISSRLFDIIEKSEIGVSDFIFEKNYKHSFAQKEFSQKTDNKVSLNILKKFKK